MSKWKVEDDGLPPNGNNVSIMLDGDEISTQVTGYTISHHANEPSELQLHARAVQVQASGDTQPQFYGLELVPTQALLQELARREDDAETLHE